MRVLAKKTVTLYTHHHHNPLAQCPYTESNIPSLLHEMSFPAIGIGCGVLHGLSPVLVSIALPFAFYTFCFPFALICHWISIVFLLYGRRIRPIRSTPPLLTFR